MLDMLAASLLPVAVGAALSVAPTASVTASKQADLACVSAEGASPASPVFSMTDWSIVVNVLIRSSSLAISAEPAPAWPFGVVRLRTELDGWHGFLRRRHLKEDTTQLVKLPPK